MVVNRAGYVFNILLGLCAVGYSFVPPERVRSYRRSVAVFMRGVGLVLIVISLTGLFLH